MIEKVVRTIGVMDDVETRCNATITAINSKLSGTATP
jgi:hypothetical protein